MLKVTILLIDGGDKLSYVRKFTFVKQTNGINNSQSLLAIVA